MHRKPLLPIIFGKKQKALAACRTLIQLFEMGRKLSGKELSKVKQEAAYILDKLFPIPYAEREDTIQVVLDQLEDWRSAIAFAIVNEKEIDRILPQLQNSIRWLKPIVNGR
jgi:hypothetical protein